MRSRVQTAIIGRMVQQIEAVYENGVLRPLSPLLLADRTQVVLQVSEARAPEAAELSLSEFDQLLDQLSTDGPTAQGTYSRAEIYADHD